MEGENHLATVQTMAGNEQPASIPDTEDQLKPSLATIPVVEIEEEVVEEEEISFSTRPSIPAGLATQDILAFDKQTGKILSPSTATIHQAPGSATATAPTSTTTTATTQPPKGDEPNPFYYYKAQDQKLASASTAYYHQQKQANPWTMYQDPETGYSYWQ